KEVDLVEKLPPETEVNDVNHNEIDQTVNNESKAEVKNNKDDSPVLKVAKKAKQSDSKETKSKKNQTNL
mgnify:CR=1